MVANQERFAHGSILEALSKGLFPDKRHIIREFVQNSFDSIYELRTRCKTSGNACQGTTLVVPITNCNAEGSSP
jgi:HSP90 family molecular chaperone